MSRKQFEIPDMYASSIIRTVKEAAKVRDPRKKDLRPVELAFGPVTFLVPRHFGFCYGVENAIDIAYRTIEENPGRRIFLLSEMIHNPTVNEDLLRRGVRFLFETDGTPLVPFESLTAEDIVIVPAFGTTLDIEEQLRRIGIDPYRYNTTCPFVEKVWKRGEQLGRKGYTLVIHGKFAHEETRATFSHTASHSHAVVVLNPEEARALAAIMTGERPREEFDRLFGERCTPGFDPHRHLRQFGVINQTTMLATETREVMEILKEAAAVARENERLAEQRTAPTGGEDGAGRWDFADTNDTLCYATNENQSATLALADARPDLSLIVGGYNSSNTMHLVEILEHVGPAFHVRDASELESEQMIHHFDQWRRERLSTNGWLPRRGADEAPVRIALTSGASCPDALVDEVLLRILPWFPGAADRLESVLEPFRETAPEADAHSSSS